MNRPTDFPANTHRRHGRAESHPKCFFLQFTHAEATCALVRRVGLCPIAREVTPGGEVANVVGGHDDSADCDVVCPPKTGGGNRGRGSLTVNGLCDNSLVEADTTRRKAGSLPSTAVGDTEAKTGPNVPGAVVTDCESSGCPGRLGSPEVSNESAGFVSDIERGSGRARGLHPRSWTDRFRFTESRSGLGLNLGCPNWVLKKADWGRMMDCIW